MIELLRRTGQLSDIYAYTVYSNDEFTIEYGLERKLTHKPAFNNPEGRGEIVGFYSVAILKDGTRAFEYMTKAEVEAHEEKYRKGKYKNNIWDKNFEEMSMKTVTKKMLKWLPISVEMIENLRKDEQSFNLNQKTNEVTGDYLDSDSYFEAEVIDNETGEIITEEKPTSDDMKTLMIIANANSLDIVKKAKELFNITDLDMLNMEQYKQLKEIAIQG